MKTIVQDLGVLPGLDAALRDVDPEDPQQVAEAARALADAKVPLEPTMSLRDGIANLVDWCRGRRLVEKLPPVTMTVPWFECHVPEGGVASLVLETERSQDRGVDLKLFGSGYRSGRAFRLSVTHETEPRQSCAFYEIDFLVEPSLYSFRDAESVTADVVGEAGTRSRVEDPCPWCSVAPDQLSAFDHELLPFIDRRDDTVRSVERMELEWSANDRFEVGVPAAVAGGSISVSVEASTRARWAVTYELPPKMFFQPYRPIEVKRFTTPMWARSG
jgi:hypothetical protein